MKFTKVDSPVNREYKVFDDDGNHVGYVRGIMGRRNHKRMAGSDRVYAEPARLGVTRWENSRVGYQKDWRGYFFTRRDAAESLLKG